MLGVNRSIGRPNGVPEEQAVAARPALQTRPSAATAVSSSALSAAAAAASPHSQTEDEAMAAATLMDFTMHPTRPAAASASAAVAAKSPTSDASLQTGALDSAAAARQIAAQSPVAILHKNVHACSDAISIIRSGVLPSHSALSIAVADDEALALFADVMTSTQHPPIHLELDRNGYTFTAAGLRHLAKLNLVSLTLKRAKFFPQDCEALAQSRYGLNLKLATPATFTQVIPGHGANTVTERTAYLQSAISVPALVQLEITDLQASEIEMAALARHPALRTVTVTVPVPGIFGYIVANPRIGKLSLDARELGKSHRFENHVFQMLRTHPALKYLSVNHARYAYLLSEIGFNTKIGSLKLHLSREAAVGVGDLAKMPALQVLSLRASEPGVVLRQADIANLCQKPLLALQLQNFTMDPPAVSTAVRAQAKHLTIGTEDTRFSSADIEVLCTNKAVSTLVLIGQISPADASKLAASPTLTRLCLAQGTSHTADAVKTITQQAWIAAGKLASHLMFRSSQADYNPSFSFQ